MTPAREYSIGYSDYKEEAAGEILCADHLRYLRLPSGARAYVACLHDDDKIRAELKHIVEILTAEKGGGE